MQLTINTDQYNSLTTLFGIEDNVHSMIMTAQHNKDSWTLSGDEQDFDDLIDTINEKISFDHIKNPALMAALNNEDSEANIIKLHNNLLEVCDAICPGEDLDWLGM